MDLESNVIQQDVFQESTSEQFSLESFSLPQSVSGILGIGITKEYVIFSTSKNEVYRYIFGRRDSLNQAYSFPPPKDKDKDKDKEIRTQSERIDKESIFFCEKIGNHTLIRHYGRMFYFNGKSSKIKELHTLKDNLITAVAWDEKNSTQNTTGSILLADANGIYEYRIDIEKDEKIKDKMSPLIKLDQAVYGLFVSDCFD